MTDLETFRAETRAWLEATAPPSLFGTRIGRFDGYWGGRNPGPVDPEVMRWFHTMLERGWTAPTWPKAYGGGGLSRDQGKILNEELQALKLPPPLVGFGLTMIGPTLLDYGTPEQKEIHLPAIIRGEVRWCQGYSEPGAGSDLASLQTRAIDQGDHFLVNGQKVWTSYADRSD
ncbi:MAG: acyl-CoA dehydrogenase family protein, partial [Myxococcota bacterium]